MREYYTGSSVSRFSDSSNRSYEAVVFESGKPVLDSDLNLATRLSNRGPIGPSGFIGREAPPFIFYPGSVALNRFGFERCRARVAGLEVVVSSTGTSGPENIVDLPPPPTSGFRTDFVFLEVWRKLVAPSPRAYATVQVSDPLTLTDGTTLTLNASSIGGPTVVFTARTTPSTPTEFAVGSTPSSAASALAAAINNPANGLTPYLSSRSSGTGLVRISSLVAGTAGNGVTAVSSAPSSLIVSSFSGGVSLSGKPSQNMVWKHGNVLSPSGEGLSDEMVDPVLGVESSQRVQVQYRIRVVSGVDPIESPYGFSDSTVRAQGSMSSPASAYPFVPADGATVLSSTSALAYGSSDGGLWVAGDGSSSAASDLGCLDGFVYALPITMVVRRSNASLTGGFDPSSGASGALPWGHGSFANTNIPGTPHTIPATKSDRPDGLFCDVVVEGDILSDLRMFLEAKPVNHGSEILSLLQGSSKGWFQDSSAFGLVAGGTAGPNSQPLVCDVIGRSSSPITAGNLIGSFDKIRTRFSSSHTIQRVVFEVLPTGPNPTGISVSKYSGTTKWHEGDVVSIDFGTLNPSTFGDWSTPAISTSVASCWPTGTKVLDVARCYHDDGSSTSPVDQMVQWSKIEGIGTTLLELTLDANNRSVNGGGAVSSHPMVGSGVSDNGSPRRLFIELEIVYPSGSGLTKSVETILEPSTSSGVDSYSGGPVIDLDPTQRPPEMDSTWNPKAHFRVGSREVALTQKTSPSGSPVTDTLVTSGPTSVRLPRVISSLVSLSVGTGTAEVGSTSRMVSLSTPVTGQSLLTVTYHPQDAIPNSGASGYALAVYYRALSNQAIGSVSGSIPTTILPTELEFEVVSKPDSLYAFVSGPGSTDRPSYLRRSLEQLPTASGLVGPSGPKDWWFCGTSTVTLAGGASSTKGSTMVQMMNPPEMGARLTLGALSLGRGPRRDSEGRAYYDYAFSGDNFVHITGTRLSTRRRRKTVSCCLVRCLQDTRAIRRGELLLAVFSHSAFDMESTINTVSDPISVGVSLYRTSGRRVVE